MNLLLHPASVSVYARDRVLSKTALSDIHLAGSGLVPTASAAAGQSGVNPNNQGLGSSSRKRRELIKGSLARVSPRFPVTNSEHARQDSDRQLLPPVISSVLTPPILSRGSHVFVAILTEDRVPRSSNLLLHLRSVVVRPQVRITEPTRRSVDSEASSLPDVQPCRFPARSSQETAWLDEIAACFTPGRPPSGLESLRNRKICNA